METRKLDIIPKGVRPVVNASQYDEGRTIKFILFSGDTTYQIPSGAVVRAEGIKKDKTGFSYECTFSGNEVTVEITRQMTVFPGDVECELRIVKDELNIGTLNYILRVESSPITDEIDISETELPAIIELAEEQAEAAAESATLSESYARGGTGTRSGEDTDNSMYYANQAALSAENADDSATESESYAKGGTNSRTGEDTDNSKYYKEQSASSASDAAQSASDALTSETNASNSAIAASGSASNAAQSASDAANSATLAEQYADFVTPHFIVENNRLYIKDDAVGEFVVANNRLYIKLAS